MTSHNSFQALNIDVPAPDSSVVSGAGTALAGSPSGAVTADSNPGSAANTLGLEGLTVPPTGSTPAPSDKNAGKRPRGVSGNDSDVEDIHEARQTARRTDPTNPFRVGDPLNPHAVKYKVMCEKRHDEQVTENEHAAAAIQLALDNGFHPDRTPFAAQPDDDVADEMDLGDALSPTVEAVRLKSQRLARAATEPRRSATVTNPTALAAEAGPAPGVDVFDVDAMDALDFASPQAIAAPHALPPPLGTAHAKSAKPNKGDLLDDALSAEEKQSMLGIHPVFEHSTVLIKAAPSSYDIEGRGPQWLLANVSLQQAADWGLYDGEHFLFVVPGAPMNDEMRAATAASLQSIVERSAPEKAKIKQPQVASANAQAPSLPLLNVFLVFGIDKEVRNGFRASTGFCVGRDNQLVFTFDLGNHASSFIYTMFGITLKDPIVDAPQVGNLVSTTLAGTNELRVLVIKIKPTLSPDLRQKSDDELIDFFLDSIHVKGMRMVSPTKRGVWITQWNVYMDHAHLFQGQHRTLRSTIAAVPIVTSFFGTGRMIKKHWYCSSCMSISHPTGLCPFTALPGWAVTQSVAAAIESDDISNRLGEAAGGSTADRGGSRGGRGGFRGGRGSHGGRGGRGSGKF